MHGFALGATALATIAFGGAASAADLAVEKAPPSTWAGTYFGASVGGVWASDRIADIDGLQGVLQTYTLKSTGIIGSGAVGYNFQWGHVVYGIEADLGGLGLNRTIFEQNVGGNPAVTTNHLGSGMYADVTARLGFAAGSALLYGKAGWAFFNGAANVDNTSGRMGGGVAAAKAFDGWTIGAGLEYLFAASWSAKVEYQHFDFGSQTATLVATAVIPGTPFRFANDLTADAVKIGVNYHFH